MKVSIVPSINQRLKGTSTLIFRPKHKPHRLVTSVPLLYQEVFLTGLESPFLMQEDLTFYPEAQHTKKQPMQVQFPQELFTSLNPLGCGFIFREEEKAEKGKFEELSPHRIVQSTNLMQLGFKSSSPITHQALMGGEIGREEPIDPKVEMASTTVAYSNSSALNASPKPFNMRNYFPPPNPLQSVTQEDLTSLLMGNRDLCSNNTKSHLQDLPSYSVLNVETWPYRWTQLQEAVSGIKSSKAKPYGPSLQSPWEMQPGPNAALKPETFTSPNIEGIMPQIHLQRESKWKHNPPFNSHNPTQQKPKVINYIPMISYKPVQLIPDSQCVNPPSGFSLNKEVGPSIVRFVAKYLEQKKPSKSSVTLVPLSETEDS